MPGYLLDTNHIEAWEREDPLFVANSRKEPPENILWVCPVSLGEIEWGLRITSTTDSGRRSDCRKFIERSVLKFVWSIETTTRHAYAEIMEEIWRRHPPPSGKNDTQQHLSLFGVDVNDVWIAAVALEHNLTLLTRDKMKTIRACVPHLKTGNWLS